VVVRLAVLILVLATLPVAACVPVTCNMPADQGPYVRLDVTAWRAAHPKAQLTVCLDAHCVDPITSQTVVDVQAGPFTRHPEVPMTLHVTGPALDVSAVVWLAKVEHDGPCPYTEWTREVTLDKQGHLRSG
jgi:hypothetical protein